MISAITRYLIRCKVISTIFFHLYVIFYIFVIVLPTGRPWKGNDAFELS